MKRALFILLYPTHVIHDHTVGTQQNSNNSLFIYLFVYSFFIQQGTVEKCFMLWVSAKTLRASFSLFGECREMQPCGCLAIHVHFFCLPVWQLPERPHPFHCCQALISTTGLHSYKKQRRWESKETVIFIIDLKEKESLTSALLHIMVLPEALVIRAASDIQPYGLLLSESPFLSVLPCPAAAALLICVCVCVRVCMCVCACAAAAAVAGREVHN